MKVAIITIFGKNNYGNRLQNYALQEVVKEVGADVVSLVPEKQKKYPVYILRKMAIIFNSFIQRMNISIEIRRKLKFDLFTDKYINSKWIFGKTRRLKKSLSSSFDYFITGSDQVWNPNFWSKEEELDMMSNYLLSFSEESKRIAYAASIGINDLPNRFKNEFYISLKKFHAISVREYSAIQILDGIGIKNANLVLDPTLLVGREKWRSIESDKLSSDKESYILLYFLGNLEIETEKIISEMARIMDLKILNLMDKTNPLYVSGPETFLEAIDKAKLVVTDSFHAIAFSLIFNTPFIALNRQQKNFEDMSSRLISLLHEVGLENRFVEPKDITQSFLSCDFGHANEKLEILRYKSKMYIFNALSGEAE